MRARAIVFAALISLPALLLMSILLLIWYLWAHEQKKTAMVLSVLEICGYSCLMQNVFYHDVVYEDYRLGGTQLAYLQDTDEDLIYRYYIPIDDVEPSYPNLNISLKIVKYNGKLIFSFDLAINKIVCVIKLSF